MLVKISADSTCDLSPELVSANQIGIMPLCVIRDGVACLDGIEITPQDIYDFFDSGKGMCSTSAVSVGDYIEFFGEALKTADAVVHLTISSDMSSCYQNALQAAEEFPGRVFPVDARNLSTGIGHLALTACELAAQGETAEKIAETLTAMREKLDVSFILDTLSYLHKGGRCSGVAALGANLLHLKPCIEVVGG
ncbi:MAG: DegV family protein, partial [Oscillospiraceae bacterium]|nr:DegV family protein [Oscillospiraceae bacterium]